MISSEEIKSESLTDKQAITGNNYGDYDDVLPVLQAEQAKKGCFEAIYEDNVWKVKPNSNDQNGKSVIEFLFLLMTEANANAFLPRRHKENKEYKSNTA